MEAVRTTASVSSVDPLSTTSSSTSQPAGTAVVAMDSSVFLRLSARLRVQMMIETVMGAYDRSISTATVGEQRYETTTSSSVRTIAAKVSTCDFAASLTRRAPPQNVRGEPIASAARRDVAIFRQA